MFSLICIQQFILNDLLKIQILRTANNFQDKGRSDKSILLFGFGDGGNGPS